MSFVPHQRCQQATERRARGNWYHGMFASNLSVIVIDTGWGTDDTVMLFQCRSILQAQGLAPSTGACSIIFGPVGRNSSLRTSRQAVPEGLGYIGAKSCNLAISRHFVQTVGKSCFSKLIFKDFHNFTPIRTLIVSV